MESRFLIAFLLSPQPFQQSQAHHRHRRENGDGDGREAGGTATDGGGELENFIALAPDEADIYNFSNNLINAVDNVDQEDGRGGTDAGLEQQDDDAGGNANEVNPFNEFLNPRQQQQQLDDPWGLGLDEQQLPPPAFEQQEQPQQVEESKYLKPVNRSRQQKHQHRQQQPPPSPIVASSIDFLNSIDGGYLLSNGIIDEKGQKLEEGE